MFTGRQQYRKRFVHFFWYADRRQAVYNAARLRTFLHMTVSPVRQNESNLYEFRYSSLEGLSVDAQRIILHTAKPDHSFFNQITWDEVK